MHKLKEKIAIVTGASKGIGAGIARALAREGASVVVNYASSRDDADRVVDEITRAGGSAIAVQGDVSNADDVRRLFDETRTAFGPLDVLVNNAGVFQFDLLEDVTEAEFHRQFNTNVLGTILATREAVKHFGPTGGSVINIGSAITHNPPATAVVYSATKGAVDTITGVLAKELGAKNIRVNSINPGGVETEGTIRLGVIGSEFHTNMIAATPLRRFGIPDDIAPVAVFLASDDSAWITGERLTAAGGYR